MSQLYEIAGTQGNVTLHQSSSSLTTSTLAAQRGVSVVEAPQQSCTPRPLSAPNCFLPSPSLNLCHLVLRLLQTIVPR